MSTLEYHRAVQRSISASVALFGLFAFAVCSGQAQVNGAPASVTSPGFGGRSVNGTPPSVTSLGRGGFAPPNSGGATFTTTLPVHTGHGGNEGQHAHHGDRDHDRDRDHRFVNSYGAVYAVPYALPYPYLANDADTPDADDDSDYQGGPTVFDRRGSGAESYVPPAQDASFAHSNPAAAPAAPEPESPQDPTTLVFKDGRQVEVGNYAIVGRVLYDLTPGHPRKIALTDLDLPATEKQNDIHGVSFQLPPGTQTD